MVWLVLMACGTSQAPTTSPVPNVTEAPVPAVVPTPPAPLPPPTEPRYAASHILVAHEGAARAREGITRSEEEARLRAESLLARLKTETFEVVAASTSDGPSAAREGRLGTFATGTMEPAFERAVASVAPGELAPLVHTPFGWHIVRRDAIEEVEVRHILIAYTGARRADSERTKDEARAKAQQLAQDLAKGGDFAALATAHSDDGSAPVGGALGRMSRGQMMPAFEAAAFALSPNETSGVVETPYGFHLILRVH